MNPHDEPTVERTPRHVADEPSAQARSDGPRTEPDADATTDSDDATAFARGGPRVEPVRLDPSTPPSTRVGTRSTASCRAAGWGALLRGRDVELGRELAVKVLLESELDRPEVLRRFLEEAQIGGQLQHPGIVPVYDLGRLDDRRPFFTMKLVRGLTLRELLRARADTDDDRPRFLAIFEDVAQTKAYAHAKGVIHRDLKPANIMVGPFGEVQVMDWGLAKTLGSRGEGILGGETRR